MGDAQIQRKGRMLILCFDGTSEKFDEQNSNIVKFFALLKKNSPREQLVYYQAGIGTYFKPGIVSPLLYRLAKLLDEACAWYLDAHVLEGYQYLMENYKEGDKICLFGFSRGAYIARALAGFLFKVGLLPRSNTEQLSFAFEFYKREDKQGLELAEGFKGTFCRDVKIEFVGVWDTVSSVGAIFSRTLPFTSSNKAIRTFRHALSLDEHRAKFQPNLYHWPSPDDPGSSAANLQPTSHSQEPTLIGTISGLSKNATVNSKRWLKENRDTDVLEVWFSGCHTDIGGGSVTDNVKKSLANIALRWMVHEVMKSQCGILFDDFALARALIPLPVFPGMASGDIPKEVELDAVDSVQPLHDNLKSEPLWWILEIIPFQSTWQDAQGKWHQAFRVNLGRGRVIEPARPIFHETVKRRMESARIRYRPKAKWVPGTEIYVS